MSVADEISPKTLGEDRIDLTLSNDTPSPIVFANVSILVNYDRCDPNGTVLPLVFTVTGPSGKGTFQRRYSRRLRPSEISFRPTEGGTHLIRLAEMFHNRWFGSLVINVAGDPIDRGVTP